MAVLSGGPARTGPEGRAFAGRQGWRMPPAAGQSAAERREPQISSPRPAGQSTNMHHGSGQSGHQAPAEPARKGVAHLTRMAGAVASLALMIGVGVWGYKLLVRDVSGIPVVRAMEGPMRVAPEDPGGEVTDYTGLAVNAIAAMGEAAPPEDVLTLAPAAEGLAPEDLEVPPAPDKPDEQLPLSAEEVLAFADNIAAGVEPLAPMPAEEAPAEDRPALISPEVPGVSVALRPQVRPGAMLTQVEQVVAEDSTATATVPEVLEGSLPEGTALVQLGAYDSPEIAASEWERLTGQFSSYLGSLDQVIQQASSGGRAFYRLRAVGFDDMGEARRLCSALIAEGADCIPTTAG